MIWKNKSVVQECWAILLVVDNTPDAVTIKRMIQEPKCAAMAYVFPLVSDRFYSIWSSSQSAVHWTPSHSPFTVSAFSVCKLYDEIFFCPYDDDNIFYGRTSDTLSYSFKSNVFPFDSYTVEEERSRSDWMLFRSNDRSNKSHLLQLRNPRTHIRKKHRMLPLR